MTFWFAPWKTPALWMTNLLICSVLCLDFAYKFTIFTVWMKQGHMGILGITIKQYICIWFTISLIAEKLQSNRIEPIRLKENLKSLLTWFNRSLDLAWLSLTASKKYLEDFSIKILLEVNWYRYEQSKHMGQNSKQSNIAKYVSKFLIYGAKRLEKCVKSKKKIFVHCPFLQS